MPARIDERTQFVDAAGVPIVNGSIYIGLQNSDPVANPITIYSDRALTIPIANPQPTDSEGRSVNKIWIPGDYSIQVDDTLATIKLIDLDAGVDITASGVTPLDTVNGTDTITAQGSPTVLALNDNELYVFQAVNNNTGAVTLNIDGLGARTIKNNLVNDLVPNDILANGLQVVGYNAGQDIFEWINQNTSNLENNLITTLQPTGLAQFYMGVTAPAGWVLSDGGTIGNATSGGTNRANADTEPLFTLLYNSMADAQAPVSGGRGAGAAADFALNKNITIPDMRGRVPVGTGGIAPAIHGDMGGAETVTLVEAEMPSHTHTSNLNVLSPRSGGGTTGGGFIVIQISGATGGDGPHANMQPWVSLSFVIKL
jgi:hypothetical protein